jgi:lipoprotein-releasing system permease protein
MLKGTKTDETSFSKPIVRIAVAGIAIGMAVMIISMAIVTGFKTEVRNKVTGFGAHIQITNLTMNNSYESESMPVAQDFLEELKDHPDIRHIQRYATKPGIVETPNDIQGVIAKGIGTDFDWSFFEDKLLEGQLPAISDTSETNDILVSKALANKINLKTGESISFYFSNVSGGFTPRKFNITGLYQTGLNEFDEQYVFLDIAHIQRINSWGLEAHLKVTPNCTDGNLIIEALTFGGDDMHQLEWNDASLFGPGPFGYCITSDTLIKVVLSDRSGTLPDSAMLAIHYPDTAKGCLCNIEGISTYTTGGGSNKQYTGGYEVILYNFDNLNRVNDEIYDLLDIGTRSVTISERIPEIFNWLDMLDINPKIIITLMVIVAVINMSSALLIMILERVNMIGLLKSLGANNLLVRKIFLYNAAYLISRGLLIGNILGIALCLIQMKFGLLTLDPANYYVSEVPVLMKWQHIVVLNIGTLLICLLVLMVPSYLVSRISPVKAIRFD